jgi:hypothetical protein
VLLGISWQFIGDLRLLAICCSLAICGTLDAALPVMARDPKRYVKTAERGLFDTMDRMSRIDRMGDPLANLNRIMNWEIFVPVLDRISRTDTKSHK